MKTVKWVVGFFVSSLIFGGTSLMIPEDTTAQVSRAGKRVDSRQGRRGDRRENTVDGAQDRQEHRDGRQDCVGDGPD